MTTFCLSPWLVTPALRPRALLRLFCFPFAGGSATFYHEWQHFIPEYIEIYAIELPGRSTRFREPLRYHMSTIITPILESLYPICDKPFAIFGHSLGSLIGFEVACRLQHAGYTSQGFLASGRRPPQLPCHEEPLHSLDDNALIKRITQYNAVPSGTWEDPDIRALFLPIIRADLQINETYDNSIMTTLNCPVFAFAGTDDSEAPPNLVKCWEQNTHNAFTMTELAGGHFFLKEDQQSFMLKLNICLKDIINTVKY